MRRSRLVSACSPKPGPTARRPRPDRPPRQRPRASRSTGTARSDMDPSRLHDRARTRGVNPIIYRLTRALLQVVTHLYWRLRRIGLDHVPAEGPVLLVCNHRSIIDPFIIGLCSPRPIYYVAKEEIFRNRLVGRLASSLGAFPVRRGKADADMIGTAKAVLGRGEPVLMFPEGTRTRPGPLGSAKRGVGRLALETGATVVPMATTAPRRSARAGVSARRRSACASARR